MNAINLDLDAWAVLDRATAPGGEELLLRRRGATFEIRIDGRELMSSRGFASEQEMARLACAALGQRAAPRVLIGGLGMGYTVRAALGALGPDAEIVVAELVAAVVAWNRGPLAPLAGDPLADKRVVVREADAAAVLRDPGGRFDAILLDVDNGPDWVTVAANAWLYAAEGLAAARAALAPGGILAVWSADPSPPFLAQLRQAGFAARAVAVPARGVAGGPPHTIFLGDRRETAPG
jgi:spermidine synthase